MNELDRNLTKVAVIGAGGKMGSGISLLLLQEISRVELSKTGALGTGVFLIHLIDQSEKSINGLYQYLKGHLKKYAEQHIQELRDYWKNNPLLISNADIIEAYVEGTMRIARFSTTYASAKEASFIFEAIVEDINAKAALFHEMEALNTHSPFYFTNTSSIPIHVLAEKGNITGRLIGFHFYNPPAVQKLVELISPGHLPPDFLNLSESLAHRLNKTIVHSKDIAGFIGNGHFIREVLYAFKKVEELSKEMALESAISFYDQVTRDLLLRPMGIFQLVDYVGLEVVKHIISVMKEFLPDNQFSAPLLNKFIEKGAKGGQLFDGTQKKGIFSYIQGRPESIFVLESLNYSPINVDKKWFEPYPSSWKNWKSMQREKDLHNSLKTYFLELKSQNTKGSVAAVDFLNHSVAISKNLVEDGVASSLKDVSSVLKLGFFHLYGPDLECLPL